MAANEPTAPVFETDDKNLAALLRAKDIPQIGRRSEVTGDPTRPHCWFQFESADNVCYQVKEAALMGAIQVNYRRFVAEQQAVMDQIFEHKRRAIAPGDELPPFVQRRYTRG